MQPDQTANRPMPFSELLRTAAQTYRACVARVSTIIASLHVPASFVQISIGTALSGVFADLKLLQPLLAEPARLVEHLVQPSTIFGRGVLLCLWVVAVLIIRPIVTGAVVQTYGSHLSQERLTLTAAYRAALQRFPTLVGASLLTFFTSQLFNSVGYLIMGGFFRSVWSLGDSTSGKAQETPSLILGLCMLGSSPIVLLVAVLSNVLLLLLPQVIMLEGRGLGAAIGRSISLTRGSFRQVLLILLLLSGFIWFIQIIFHPLYTVLKQILISEPNNWFAEGVLANGVWYLMEIVLLPVYFAVTTVLYFDLRARHEGAKLR